MKPVAAAWLLFICLGHWALRLNSLPLPYLSDEGEYAYQAHLLAQGGLPYRDAYNQKPPIVFFCYRAAFALFGEKEQSPRLLAMIFCWLTMFLLYRMTPDDWPENIRLTAPGLFASLSTLPVGDMGFAANTESFLILPSTLCAFLLLKPHPRSWVLFAAGSAAGAALMTKQTALWTALAFAAWLALRSPAKERSRNISLFDAGLLSLPAALLAYWFSKDGLGDFWEQVVSRNMDYASLMASAAGEQWSWFAAQVAPQFLRGCLPALLLALYGLSATRISGSEPLGPLAALWLGASAVGAITGLFFFPHYFLPLMAPLSLLAAMGLKRLHEKRIVWASPWVLAGLLFYAPLVYARSYLSSPEIMARELLYPNPLYESKAAAEYLSKRAAPGEAIYVFGSEPQIYVYSRRRSPTRHNFIYPLTLFPRGNKDILAELETLTKFPPRFIVYVNLNASTLIASAPGQLFQENILELLKTRYRWDVIIPSVTDASPARVLPAALGAFPDLSREGLYVFEYSP